MMYVSFVRSLTMNCIDNYIKEYQAYILTYAETNDETTLYSCSELGKTFAQNEFSVEETHHLLKKRTL